MNHTPLEILQTYWKHTSFRSLQEDIINSVIEGNDVLALLPTGGGKSVCFQVPGIFLDGVCLVITPLIALMKDQVEQLKARGISASSLDSGMNRREIQIALENTANGAYKFLYLSPERLKTSIFKNYLTSIQVSLLVVDEAHCISQWGYDFRPSYLEIADIREMIHCPVIALTATATNAVKKDIAEKLKLKAFKTFQKSFARSNLSYSCFDEEDKLRKMVEILNNVPGTSIIYVRSRRRTKEVAEFLIRKNIVADFYHAGLSHTERASKQENWIKNRCRVIVSTNAFGMGIDKPDVRTVVHLDIPESLEAYYQEAGRAGRDEKKAYAILLFSQLDAKELEEKLEQKYPDLPYILRVYQALSNHFQVAAGDFDIQTFNFEVESFYKTYALEPKTTFYALKILEQQGFIALSEGFYSPSKVYIPDHKLLYEFQVANANSDIFIKTLLRTYGGELYNDFVKISESGLSGKMNASIKIVIETLNFLSKSGILMYEPQNDKPQISFFKHRYRIEDLPFDKKNYASRKEEEQRRMDAVIEYFSNSYRCRTKMLLEYFDEISDEICGICDNCIKSKKAGEHIDDNLEKYRLQILKILEDHDLLPEELANHDSLKNKQNAVLAIRSLVESSKLQYNSSGKLSIKR